MNIRNISIPDYVFSGLSNPFAFDADEPKSLKPIATLLEGAIEGFDTDNILLRGVQSGHHKLTRDALIEKIQNNGSDIYDSNRDEGVIHAAPYSAGMVENLLAGFHVYKPKSEERPQYPVDIWMIFDRDAYNNVEYMHPRHHVLARDKWERKSGESGLIGLVIVN